MMGAREAIVLPGVQSRCVVGVRNGFAVDALRSGGGLDAPEELPSGSMQRISIVRPDVVCQTARLRAGYRGRGS